VTSGAASGHRSAVVIGAGIAGLCAARSLAGHVERVVLVERDRLPDGPVTRSGVPQAHHIHALTTGGQRALERLFPGFQEQLIRRGGYPLAVPTDVLLLTPTGWQRRFPATHTLLCASRELIEWTIRQHMSGCPGLTILDGHEVFGLRLRSHGTSIAGVELQARRESGPPHYLSADIVVDASGRGSRMPAWLSAHGFGRPAETCIDAGAGYASRRYLVPDGADRDWKALMLLPKPPDFTRAGVLSPIEDRQWIVTLVGLGADGPPVDDAGFLAFARGIRSPLLFEAIDGAVPNSPIHGARHTSNRRRHYERMTRWPRGLLVVGDAVCCLNPVYGQGMSIAALTAVAIDDMLRAAAGRRDSDVHQGIDHSAQRTLASYTRDAWTVATGADLRFATTTGARPGIRHRLFHRYLDRVSHVANHDRHVFRALRDIAYLVRPPATVLRPSVVARVLYGRRETQIDTPPTNARSSETTTGR